MEESVELRLLTYLKEHRIKNVTFNSSKRSKLFTILLKRFHLFIPLRIRSCGDNETDPWKHSSVTLDFSE